MYERTASTGARITAEFDGGISWISHPDEDGKRASHAIRTENGVWLLDPLDAPNVQERVSSLGEVTGIAVLSCWHARDAALFGDRHDVSVHIPEWMCRIEELVEAPIERYTLSPDPEFRILPCRPFPNWEEVFLYHEPSDTLIVPDSLGTIDPFVIEDERLGLELFRRLQPPRQLDGLEPARILVGHGEAITVDAPDALRTALANARLSFPKALLENGPESVRSIVDAMRD